MSNPTTFPDKKKRRACELLGLGLSNAETAGAMGVSTTSIERMLRTPEYRAMVDDARKQRSVPEQIGAILRDLIAAENHDGEPRLDLRLKAVELAARFPELIGMASDDDEGDLLVGAVVYFPGEEREDFTLPDADGEHEQPQGELIGASEWDDALSVGTVAPPE